MMGASTASGLSTPRADDWRDSALCRGEDPDLWFPSANTPESLADAAFAKAICAACPSKRACLQWAYAHRQAFGIWGGLDEVERRAANSGGPLRPVLADECDRGHPYTAANTHINRRGHRNCRTCRNHCKREYERRQRAGVPC